MGTRARKIKLSSQDYYISHNLSFPSGWPDFPSNDKISCSNTWLSCPISYIETIRGNSVHLINLSELAIGIGLHWNGIMFGQSATLPMSTCQHNSSWEEGAWNPVPFPPNHYNRIKLCPCFWKLRGWVQTENKRRGYNKCLLKVYHDSIITCSCWIIIQV